MNPFESPSEPPGSDKKSLQYLQSQQFSQISQSTQQTSQISSPTKSIKNYFKNRSSLKSIESISESPEKETIVQTLLQPSTSPSRHGGLLLPSRLSGRPSFTRSRSSLASVTSSAGAGAVGVSISNMGVRSTLSPSRVIKAKPVEIEDFADSDSGSEYDADSVNDILSEYGIPQLDDKRASTFLFQEDLSENYERTRKEEEREKAINKLTNSQKNSPLIGGALVMVASVSTPGVTAVTRAIGSSKGIESIGGKENSSTHNKASDRQLERSSSLGNRSLDARSSVLSGSNQLGKIGKRTLRTKSIIELSLEDTHNISTEHSNASTSSNYYYDAKEKGGANSSSSESNNNRSASSGIQSFHIYTDNLETSPKVANTVTMKSYKDRRTISTSSNIDNNRSSSLYNMTTISGFEMVQPSDPHDTLTYEPGSTANDTAGFRNSYTSLTQTVDPVIRMHVGRPNVPHSQESSVYMSVNSTSGLLEKLEAPLNSHNVNVTVRSDEVALRNSSNMSSGNKTTADMYSLSSGELLNTLQGYDEDLHEPHTNNQLQYDEQPPLVQSQDTVHRKATDNNIPSTPLVDMLNIESVHGSVAKLVDIRYSSDSPIKRLVQTQSGKPSPESRNSAKNSVRLFSIEQPVVTPQRAASRIGSGGSGPGSASGYNNTILISRPSSVPSHNSHDTRITDYINKNLNNGIEDFRQHQPRFLGSQTSFGSIQPPNPVGPFQDTIERQTSHERMLTEKGQTGEDLLYPNPKDLEKRAGLYSAGIDPNTSLSLLYNSYSWIRWFLFMVCGLVAPPIFFLLSMGSFDSRSHPSSCYTGYYYTGEQAIVTRRKFSRTQKTTSFVIGILCCMIVLAMIGVGFGIGIRNEHNF